MSWTYHQASGAIAFDGAPIGGGYAGGNIPPNFNPAAKNNPAWESVHLFGPLPRGGYTIGEAYHDPQLGPCAMRLTPNPANQMYGRGGFFMHCDSIHHPGQASEGCIVLPLAILQRIAASPDRELQVEA